MDLVEQLLVAGMHVQLLLVAASHAGPQLAGQWLLACFQITQQGGRDGDVVTPVIAPSSLQED